MGKKKTSKKGGRGDEDEVRSADGSDKSGVAASAGPDGIDFEALMISLCSRTQATRDGALKQLRQFMLQTPDGVSALDDHAETIVAEISKAVRNGVDQEATLEVAQVAALFFADGESASEVSDRLGVLACYVYKNEKYSPEERCAALRLLTVCHLSNPFLDLGGDSAPQLLHDVWNANAKAFPPTVFAEALACWTVCVSQIDDTQESKPLMAFFAEGQKVANLVGNVDYDISCAAIECLGLCYEAAGKALGRAPPGLGRKDPEAVMEVILAENDKTVTKGKRKVRKEIARKALATIEDSTDVPSERVQVGVHKLEFEGWKRTLQLDLLRDVLGGGIKDYLKCNSVAREVLAIGHLDLGATKNRRDRREEKQRLAESARENDKLKTMRDHKKSAAKLQARYDED